MENPDADNLGLFSDIGEFNDDDIDNDPNKHFEHSEPGNFDDDDEFRDNVLDDDLNDHVAHDSRYAEPPRLSPKDTKGI